MITFQTETHRLQYTISGHEVLPPHGPMLFYVQSSGRYYAPISAGRGSARWEYKGTAVNRAYGGGNTLKLNEAVADQAKETVLPGDERVIIDSLLLDGELVIGETAQLTFLPGVGGEYVNADDEEFIEDDRVLDEELVLDGTLTFKRSSEQDALPLTMADIADGVSLTIPEGLLMPAAGRVIVMNGELIVNGEIV